MSKYPLVDNDALQEQNTGYSAMPQPTPPAYAPVQQQPAQMTGFATPPQLATPGGNVLTSQPHSTFLVSNTTTIVTTQPGPRKWRQNLCDCCSNCGVCMSVYCLGLCYRCAIAQRLDENPCILFCPGGLALLRAKMRTTHRIEGTLMGDICATVWCEPCVLCQMGVELNAEGYPKGCCGL